MPPELVEYFHCFHPLDLGSSKYWFLAAEEPASADSPLQSARRHLRRLLMLHGCYAH